MSAKMIVLSGPSGVGKSSIIKRILAKYPDMYFSVSVTTREMRPTDVEGSTYYFVDHPTFKQMIADDQFYEYAEFVEHSYGTPRKPIDAALEAGRSVLLDVEPVGALNIKKLRPDAVLIFISAPSFEELRRRLVERNDTPMDVIEQRLERAKWDYAQAPKYDHNVVNDDFERALAEIDSIINAE